MTRIEISGADLFEKLASRFSELGPGLKYAAASALSRTAKEVREDYRRETTSIFKKPGAFVRNSMFVGNPDIKTLSIELGIKDADWEFRYGHGNKGMAPADVLAPQIRGGGRALKRGEKLLAPFGFGGEGAWYIPGKGGLNSSGKLKPGVVMEILASLGLSQYGNRTTRSRRRNPKRAEYVPLKTKNGNGFAIYKTSPTGRKLGYPVLVFMRHPPQYEPRFPVGEIVRRGFDEHFPKELESAAERIRAKFSKG